MTAIKLSHALLFALIFAAALSGCSSPSSAYAQPGSADNKPPNVAQAEYDLRNAEKRLMTATQAAQDAKDKADRAKGEADKLEERARRNGVDVNDPKSQTAQARDAQKQAEDDAAKATAAAETAKRDVETAKANLDAAHGGTRQPVNVTSPVPRPYIERGFSDSLYAWLPLSALSLLGVALLAAMFWWTWKKIAGVNAEAEQIRRLIKKQDEIPGYLRASVSGIRDLSQRLAVLQEDMFRLTLMVKTMSKEQSLQGRLVEPYSAVSPASLEDDYAKVSPDFPIAAHSFLARLGGAQQIVKHDWPKNLLVKDQDGRGQLVLVCDSGVSGGQLYIVPRVTRFQTREDFYNYYEQFYDCDHPGAGEVWVNAPAVVDGVDGGWKLLEKGELEVKQ
jgi:hypothetical protein